MKQIQMLVLPLCVLLLTACTAVSAAPSFTPIPTFTPAWMAALAPVTQAGVDFLKGQYNTELELL